MTKYVDEKDNIMPLCAIIDNKYFNYITGETVSEDVTVFINQKLKHNTAYIKEFELCVYEIAEYPYKYSPFIHVRNIIGYIYQINGVSNFLDSDKRLLDGHVKQFIIDNIMKGKYEQELIWGDDIE